MLNELDKELEKRGLRFTRYADDCVIVVGSEASAKRVMASITEWIERKLGLKVNMTKTQITRPPKVKYLGYSFWYDTKEKKWKARPHESSVQEFRRKLKRLCKRSWSISMDDRIKKINALTRGWVNYFAFGNMKSKMAETDEHLRTMIRMVIWKQWKVPSKREWGLKKLGVDKDLARLTSYCGNRYYWVVTKTCVVRAISKEILKKRGLVSIYDYYMERHALKVD